MTFGYDHTSKKTRKPVRSCKLSFEGPSQYCDGWPHGNTWCCIFGLWAWATFLPVMGRECGVWRRVASSSGAERVASGRGVEGVAYSGLKTSILSTLTWWMMMAYSGFKTSTNSEIEFQFHLRLCFVFDLDFVFVFYYSFVLVTCRSNFQLS